MATNIRPVGSRKQAKWAQVFAESAGLHEALACLRGQVFSMHPADWTAGYILLCLSYAFPKGFVGGKLSVELVGDPCAFPTSQVWADGQKRDAITRPKLTLDQISGLKLTPCDVKRVGGMATPALQVLQNYQLACLPIFVNTCLVHWGSNLRPLVLMDRAASPKELLLMQSEGRRCVTCYCQPAELGTVYTDSYTPYASKDALHFAVHDLQHMEKFVAPQFYAEQVGFLARMVDVHKLWPVSPKRPPQALEGGGS